MKANSQFMMLTPILSLLILFQSCKTYQSEQSLSQSSKIEISEDLINIAKAYPVKQKIHRKYLEFECGNYQILNSKIKTEPVAVTYISKENKEIHHNHSEINFVLTNNLGGIANLVSVYDHKTTYLIKENLLLIILGIEDEPEEELIEVNRIEKTTFTTNYNIEKEWILISEYTFINDKKTNTNTLTDGERLITIVEVKPINNNNYNMVSAPKGYEFVENNESLCAYQTQGGAVIGLGLKNKIIWLRPDIDEETNLVLVAAMASFKIHIQ